MYFSLPCHEKLIAIVSRNKYFSCCTVPRLRARGSRRRDKAGRGCGRGRYRGGPGAGLLKPPNPLLSTPAGVRRALDGHQTSPPSGRNRREARPTSETAGFPAAGEGRAQPLLPAAALGAPSRPTRGRRPRAGAGGPGSRLRTPLGQRAAPGSTNRSAAAGPPPTPGLKVTRRGNVAGASRRRRPVPLPPGVARQPSPAAPDPLPPCAPSRSPGSRLDPHCSPGPARRPPASPRRGRRAAGPPPAAALSPAMSAYPRPLSSPQPPPPLGGCRSGGPDRLRGGNRGRRLSGPALGGRERGESRPARAAPASSDG